MTILSRGFEHGVSYPPSLHATPDVVLLNGLAPGSDGPLLRMPGTTEEQLPSIEL